MKQPLYSDVAKSFGFSEADAANVRSLAEKVKDAIPSLADRIYQGLVQRGGAVDVLAGRDREMESLRGAIAEWLTEMLEGRHSKENRQKQRRIGAARVRDGVPQQYIVAGIDLVWQEFGRWVQERRIPEPDKLLSSLHRLLMIELAVMLNDYQRSYAERIRERERSVVEEKLTRAQHLAEIGQLAASLAHEIKNPLAGISGAAQIIRDAMPADDPHQPIVTEILGQINRLDATVKDLLQYARPTPPRAQNVALDDVVERVLTVLKKEPAVQRVRIEHEPAETAAVVFADEGQIEQLLINLILNAAQASEDGGVIHVDILAEADNVNLLVRDEGAGMTPEVRERTFEPFFTTKARGTGLGLTICRRIVEVHGGTIELNSEPDTGTTVTVSLPTKNGGSRTVRTAQERSEV
jgi:signal transduction histidine kinase